MKQEIREQLSALRKGLDKSYVSDKSIVILEKLFSLQEYKEAQSIILYDSIGNEVVINQLSCNGKKLVGIPLERVDNSRVKIKTKLKEQIIDHTSVDLIIIPGVGFDEQKNRLGRGGGFYDRFLENMNVKKIALAFEFQVLDKIPTEPQDIKMDIIVTEERIIQ